MKTGEYEIKEMKALIESLSGMYDLVRVVDPAERRVLKLGDDGSISMKQSCYCIWDSDQKCANCSSALSCKTGCNHEKAEYFRDSIYNIQSNPVRLKLSDGGVFEAVVELVSIKSAELLQEIADNCSGLCSRLYRDKFAVLLPAEKYNEDIFTKAAQIINDTFTTGVYTIRVLFGVYDVTNHDIPISVMCDRANMSLRNLNGSFQRNIAYFDDTIMQKSIDEQKIISGFDTALAEGHLCMYLQPLIKEDEKLFGAEALARWIYPDGTVISPAVFIKILEDAGLIHKLDKYIWEQAVKQLNVWKNTEMNKLSISVNMSAKDFYNIDVYSVLMDLVEKYDVEHEKLRIEITESTLIENIDNIYPIISKLQAAVSFRDFTFLNQFLLMSLKRTMLRNTI